MKNLVEQKFNAYPGPVRSKLEVIRGLILSEAEKHQLDDVEETLKWGEPSYLVKGGSTVRFDWKMNSPGQYAIYFNCKTTLVYTFKELYADTFTYEGNRAIVFKLEDPMHEDSLRHCLQLALTYHKVKHLPLLGA